MLICLVRRRNIPLVETYTCVSIAIVCPLRSLNCIVHCCLGFDPSRYPKNTQEQEHYCTYELTFSSRLKRLLYVALQNGAHLIPQILQT